MTTCKLINDQIPQSFQRFKVRADGPMVAACCKRIMAPMPGQDNQDTEKQTWCASELKSNEKNRRSWLQDIFGRNAWEHLGTGVGMSLVELISSDCPCKTRIFQDRSDSHHFHPPYIIHARSGQHFCASLLQPFVDWWNIATEYTMDLKASTQG